MYHNVLNITIYEIYENIINLQKRITYGDGVICRSAAIPPAAAESISMRNLDE